MRVAIGSDNTDGLVDGVVDQFLFVQQRSVDMDFADIRINGRAKFRDRFSVDDNASFFDQFFALSATTEASRGEESLQTLSLVSLRSG